MKNCRNCDAADLVELGFIGRIAPFFLKRVFNIQMHVSTSRSRAKQSLRSLLRPFRSACAKLFSSDAYLEMQSCRRCSFVQAKHPIPEEWITRLYLDYRSETYNSERIQYEPSYARIAAHVGTAPLEVSKRVEAATLFLTGKLDITPEFTMLDYGGADGRFLPPLADRRYVYEISDIVPIPGVQRIASVETLGQYSYIHLAHVLEHVMYPLHLVRQVVERIEPRGYLYIEVPQDAEEQYLRQFQQGQSGIELSIHEHINYYSIAAVSALMRAVGLDVVATEIGMMDVGWGKAVHIRALGRKI
jgi:hypothetical protein